MEPTDELKLATTVLMPLPRSSCSTISATSAVRRSPRGPHLCMRGADGVGLARPFGHLQHRSRAPISQPRTPPRVVHGDPLPGSVECLLHRSHPMRGDHTSVASAPLGGGAWPPPWPRPRASPRARAANPRSVGEGRGRRGARRAGEWHPGNLESWEPAGLRRAAGFQIFRIPGFHPPRPRTCRRRRPGRGHLQWTDRETRETGNLSI